MEEVDDEQTDSEFPEPPEKSGPIPTFSRSNTAAHTVSQEEDIGHTVTLTVTVALACTKSNDEQCKLIEELVKRNKRTVEAPKPLQFFHCEYSITPEHASTVADIVTYGVAAKVFTENDSKVVKTWDDGPLTWVAWVHSHEVSVTDDNVLDLYGHTLDFKLWDSKDKVSAKARFDRPKAFRLPSSKDVPGKGVAAVVAKQSRSWNNLQPQNSNHQRDEQETIVNTETEVKEKAIVSSNEANVTTVRVRSSLGRLAGYNMSDQEKKRMNELKQQQVSYFTQLCDVNTGTTEQIYGNGRKSLHQEKLNSSQFTQNVNSKLFENNVLYCKKRHVDYPQPSKLMKQLSSRAKPNDNAETVKKEDMESSSANQAKKTASENVKSRFASVKIKLESLFSGIKEITSRLSEPSINVKDMYVSVTVGGNLLPEELEKKLNPMVITIKSVKDLPNTPISQERLSSICQPVYCSYKFLGNPVHTTASRPHSKDIYFEDMHVVLTGQIDPGNLFEFLHYNSLNIEVHDRDRKLPDTIKPPLLFGDDKDDKLIANVGMSTSKNTTHNAFSDRHRVFDPYGVAKLFLKELLHGQIALHLLVVVNPCRTPDLVNNPNSKEKGERLVGVAGAIDRPENPPLLAGDYLNFGTVLKVKITLKYPLSCSALLSPDCSMLQDKCPFGRIVYHFSYENKKLLQKLESFVKTVNTKALNLEHFQPHVLEVALSTYKLSPEQKVSTTLNVVTGFHVMDGENHILVLEGLKTGAIQTLQKDIGRDHHEDDGFVRMLCDSSVSFTSRLYADLDVNLCTVKLHQPLKKIIQQPLLYVRDLVPQQCFKCLALIEQITWMNRLRDVCHNDLFPSYDMVISMSREFGVPLTYGDYEEHHKPDKDDECGETIQVDQSNMKLSDLSRWTPIDHTNVEYDRYLKERRENKTQMPDYILNNIVAIQEAGKRKRPMKVMVECDIRGPPHNYSTQTLNSTELSKHTLRRMLYKDDPKSRFAYNPYYNSAVVAPIDEDEFYDQLENTAKQYWRTDDGFVFPGVKSSLLSNVHPLRPDSSRITELKLKWRENTLHSHKLAPTLKRDTWSWELRHQDVDLYRKPAKTAERGPLSIHLPGVKRLDEKIVFYKKLQQEWKSKIVVASPRMKFHRVSCNTEQTNKSNQVDKLRGVLKDDPQKVSLKFYPAMEIPPLSVVAYPSVDTSARKKGKRIPVDTSQEKLPHIALQPGPYENRGWCIDKNTIPIWDPQHKLFSQLKGRDFTTYVRDREYLWHGPKLPKEETVYEPMIKSSKPKLRDESWIYEQSTEEIDRRKSEYREEYYASEGVQRSEPIYPLHQLHGLSHVLENAPFKSDASVQLVQDAEEEEKTQLKKKKPTLYQSAEDDVEYIGNSGIKSSSRLAQVMG